MEGGEVANAIYRLSFRTPSGDESLSLSLFLSLSLSFDGFDCFMNVFRRWVVGGGKWVVRRERGGGHRVQQHRSESVSPLVSPIKS